MIAIRNSARRRLLAPVAIAFAVLALAGCETSSSSDSGDKPSAVERNNDQAQREFQICMKQADQIARTQGADAGSAKIDECTNNLANESQVEP